MISLTRESDALSACSSTWQTKSFRSFAPGSELSSTSRSCLLDQNSSNTPIRYDDFLTSELSEISWLPKNGEFDNLELGGSVWGDPVRLQNITYGDFPTSRLREASQRYIGDWALEGSKYSKFDNLGFGGTGWGGSVQLRDIIRDYWSWRTATKY